MCNGMKNMCIWKVISVFPKYHSLLVAVYIKQHLKKILLELNGDKERPAYFLEVFSIMLDRRKRKKGRIAKHH
jgi:hypothetical protein